MRCAVPDAAGSPGRRMARDRGMMGPDDVVPARPASGERRVRRTAAGGHRLRPPHATYRLALLQALLDLCARHSDAHGRAPQVLYTRDIAEQMASLYWPQVIPYLVPGAPGATVLRQITSPRATIVTAVSTFRSTAGAAGVTRNRRTAGQREWQPGQATRFPVNDGLSNPVPTRESCFISGTARIPHATAINMRPLRCSSRKPDTKSHNSENSRAVRTPLMPRSTSEVATLPL